MKLAPTSAGASRVTRELTRASAPSNPPTATSLVPRQVPRCSRFSLRDAANPAASSDPENQQTLFHLIFRPLALRCHLSRWSWQPEPSGFSVVDRAELPSCRRRSLCGLCAPRLQSASRVDSAPSSLRRSEFCLSSLHLLPFLPLHCDAVTGSCNVAALCNFQPPTACATLAPVIVARQRQCRPPVFEMRRASVIPSP